MADQANLLRMLEPAVRPAGAPAPTTAPKPPVDQQSFDQLLESAASAADAMSELKVSAHAEKRLSQMGIELSDAQMRALNEATDKAAEKGANDSLMLIDRLGLIVNIPNRTVITALSEQPMTEGVVTNIDSTVWVDENKR